MDVFPKVYREKHLYQFFIQILTLTTTTPSPDYSQTIYRHAIRP